MRISHKVRSWIEKWTYENQRAIDSYRRRHGADEPKPDDIRLIDGQQLRRERHECIRQLSQEPEQDSA